MTNEPIEITGDEYYGPGTDQDDEYVPVPIEEDPAPPIINADPLVTSVFMKVSRAVDGDDHFKQRVEMALEISGLPQTRANIIHISKSVAGSIVCTVAGTIDTSGVTDEQIIEAMDSVPDKNF